MVTTSIKRDQERMYHRSHNIPAKTARYRCNGKLVHSQKKLPVYSQTNGNSSLLTFFLSIYSSMALAHLQPEQQSQNTTSNTLPFLILFVHYLIEQRTERYSCVPMAGAAANDDLKLLGVWTGLFTIRVRVALNLKGLSYEYVEEDLSNKSALLLSSNPVNKTVPVLLHAGRAINESQIILEYIDEVWPAAPALLPSDPYERATARFWAAYIEDKVRSAWFGMVFGCKDEEERADAVARAGEAFDTLEGAFRDCSKQGEKPFFGGDGIGFVDLMLGGYLGWFGAVGKIVGRRLIDPAKTPLLAAWEDRFRALDAAKGVVPDDVDKVLAFLQVLLAWRAGTSSK